MPRFFWALSPLNNAPAGWQYPCFHVMLNKYTYLHPLPRLISVFLFWSICDKEFFAYR
jgi:hypothetical protein